MTTCLRCRVIRLRVIARSFLAFGRTPEQVKEAIKEKNPDLEVWVYHSYPDEKPTPYQSLNISKDGWHFQLARIPG